MKTFKLILFLLWAIPLFGQSNTSASCSDQTLLISRTKGNKAALRHVIKCNKKYKWVSNPELLYLEGVLRFSTTKFYKEKDEVIKLFSKYINEKPNEAKGYLRRGITYLSQRNENLAILDFNTAIDLDESIAITYFYKAQALHTKKLYLDAISAYSQFITLIDSSNHLYDLASFHRALCNMELKGLSGLGDYDGWRGDLPIQLHTFPVDYLPIDTMKREAVPLNRYLTLITNNTKKDTITVETLTNIDSINSLFGTQSLDTFRVYIIKGGMKFTLGSEDPKYWMVYKNTNNSLNTLMIENLNQLSINDEVHIDHITGRNDKGEKVFPLPKMYKTKITAANKT